VPVPMPSFHDPIATARQEAVPRLERGLAVHPTLIAFEGEEPTLYLRGRPPTCVEDDEVIAELLLLPDLLDLTRLLVVSEVRLGVPEPFDVDPEPVGTHSRAVRPDLDSVEAALAGRAITVDRVERDALGAISRDGLLLEFHLDDQGGLRFEPPEPLPQGGPWAEILATRMSRRQPPDADDDFSPPGAVYALSRFGVVVAVAPGWGARYGFDRPVDPAMVRPEDRRRAQTRLRHRAALTTPEPGR